MKTAAPRETLQPAPQRGALKLRDACEYLGGLSVPTMHRLIDRGLIRPNRSLRHLLFPISELDRFLRAGMG
jgi:excisionase family DNA binding protein